MTDAKHREAHKETCLRLDKLCRKLALGIGPIDSASAMLVAGLNTLVDALGPAGAVDYLREMTFELERDSENTTH